MNLTKYKRIAFRLILLLSIYFLASCEMATPVSVNERINMFFDDVSTGPYTTIRGDHIHPDASNWANLDANYWENTSPWDNKPFTVNTSNIPNSTSVSVNVTNGSSASTTYTFYMKEEDADVWKITGVNGVF